MTRIQCKDCHIEFEFTTEEQTFFAKKGYATPKRCPACRAKRRRLREQETLETKLDASLHEVQCSACGTLTRVPFEPTDQRPVYCETCFEFR